jgi:hypothetical protein
MQGGKWGEQRGRGGGGGGGGGGEGRREGGGRRRGGGSDSEKVGGGDEGVKERERWGEFSANMRRSSKWEDIDKAGLSNSDRQYKQEHMIGIQCKHDIDQKLWLEF